MVVGKYISYCISLKFFRSSDVRSTCAFMKSDDRNAKLLAVNFYEVVNSRLFVVMQGNILWAVERKWKMPARSTQLRIPCSFKASSFLPRPRMTGTKRPRFAVRAVSNHNGTDIRKRFAIETFYQISNNWKTAFSKHVLVLLSTTMNHKP